MRLNRWFLILRFLLGGFLALAEDTASGTSGDKLVDHLRATCQPTHIRTCRDARFEMLSDDDNECGKVIFRFTGVEFATTGLPDHRVVNTEHTCPQSKFVERMPMRSDAHKLSPTNSRVTNTRRYQYFEENSAEESDRW